AAIRRVAAKGRRGPLSARAVGEPGGAASYRRRTGHSTSQRLAESLAMRQLDRGRRLSGRQFLAARDRSAKGNSRFVRRSKRLDRRGRAQGAEGGCCRRVGFGVQRIAIYGRRWLA